MENQLKELTKPMLMDYLSLWDHHDNTHRLIQLLYETTYTVLVLPHLHGDAPSAFVIHT